MDVSGSEGRDPKADFDAIMEELNQFSPDLASRPMLVAGNKADSASSEQIADFQKFIEEKGLAFYAISAVTTQGVKELCEAVWLRVKELPPIKIYEAEERPVDMPEGDHTFNIHRADDAAFEIEAPFLERVLSGVNMDDYESLQYFQRVLRMSGIIDRLEEMGIEEGDTVRIFDFEFEYIR